MSLVGEQGLPTRVRAICYNNGGGVTHVIVSS